MRSQPLPRWMVDANMLDIGRAMASVRSDVVYPGHPAVPEIGRDALDDDWIPVPGPWMLALSQAGLREAPLD